MISPAKKRFIFAIFTLIVSSVLISAIFTTGVIWFIHTTNRLNQQKIHWNVAPYLKAELSTLLAPEPDWKAVAEFFDNAVQTNPEIELYLLDANGSILYSSNEKSAVATTVVPLEKIETFLSEPQPKRDRGLFHLNPTNPLELEPFSAARLMIGGEPAVLYAVLISSTRRAAFRKGTKVAHVIGLIIAILAALSVHVGSSYFQQKRMKQRVQKLTTIADQISRGNFAARLDEEEKDELENLRGHINLIADQFHNAVVEAQESDRVRRELISNISHDLNTPLTSALGYVRRAAESSESNPEERPTHFLNSALVNLDLLQKLLADLFEYTKLDSKELEPQWEKFSVLDLVTEEILPLFAGKAEERGIILRAEYPPSVPFAFGDGDLITRVLINLTENAIRYSGSGSEAVIRIAVDESSLRISVSDTGAGISAEDQKRIFERFYRADKSRKKGEGTGLGLAIVKKILKTHNKSISIHSEIGVGSSFEFSLDRADKMSVDRISDEDSK